MRMRVDQDVPWPACIGNLSRETVIAFARAGRASTETAIAFADEKWAYLARISVALVLSVSMSVVQGRALVMVVSRWSASVAAEVSLVSTSPRHSCLCAKKFALRGPVVGVSAKKFALLGPMVGASAKTPLEGSRRAKFFAEQSRNSRGTERAGRVLSHHQSGTPAAGRPSSQIEQGTDSLRPPRADGHEKSTPEGVLGRNAEPPPVDRTEGGRCAPGGTRTPNLLNRNQMLYPLSYGRFAVWLSISLHASRRDAKSNDMA